MLLPELSFENTVGFDDARCQTLQCWLALEMLSSFFLAGRVFSPALRPYMIGPMRSPDIQNLLEAFARIKREKYLKGLCKPKERRIYRPLQASREISSGVNHWSSNKSQTNPRPHKKNLQTGTRQRVNRHPTASGLAHSFSGAVTGCSTRRYTGWLVVSLG